MITALNTEKKVNTAEEKCAMQAVVDLLGSKWAMPVVYILFSGTMRFKELERSIPDINTRMLVKELKKMEKNGIISRKVYATVPPTVEYAMTAKGKKLEPIFMALYAWAEEYDKS